MDNSVAWQRNWKLPFFIIWTGQAVSLFGSALVQFALVWWLTTTTESATVLATATLVAILPNIVLGPVAGVLVDRWPRRRVLIVADSLVALATLVLAYLFYAGLAQVWHVYAIMFARAVAGIFHFPAMQASTSLMVPQTHLSRVAGFNQMLQGGMNVVAPPMGALLLGLLPLQGVLAIDVATAAIGILPLLFILIPQPPQPASDGSGGTAGALSFGAQMMAGLRYMRAWPGLLGLLGMLSVINFALSPAGSLLPILVTRHFGGTVVHLATLNSVFGLGAISGGIILGVWGGFQRRILTSLMGLVGIGLGFIVVGLSPASALWMAAAGLGLAAVMIPITNGPIMAVLQATVAPDMQGRVFTLVMSVAGAMAPLGLAVAGPVADAIGVQTWYVFGGSVCALMGGLAFFIPAITHLEARGSAAPIAAAAPAGD